MSKNSRYEDIEHYVYSLVQCMCGFVIRCTPEGHFGWLKHLQK